MSLYVAILRVGFKTFTFKLLSQALLFMFAYDPTIENERYFD